MGENPQPAGPLGQQQALSRAGGALDAAVVRCEPEGGEGGFLDLFQETRSTPSQGGETANGKAGQCGR